jgi:tape measure domain-containing protein
MAGTTIGGLAANVSADVGPFNQAMNQAGRSAERFGGRLDTTGMQLESFVRSAGAAAAAYLSVSELISRSDEWTVFSNKIRMATEAFGTYQETQRAVYNLAQSMAAPVDDVGAAYLRLQNSVKGLGVSQADTLKVTEGLLKSFISFGQSAAEAGSTVQQLGQALGAGKLNGDELKSVMENSLPVAEAIAKQFGVTTGELKKLGEEGKLTSKEVFQGLLNGSDAFISSFDKLSITFDDGFTTLSNSATRAVGEFTKMTGASEFFGASMQGLAAKIDTFSDSIESGKFGQLAGIFERQWKEVFGDRIPEIVQGMYTKLETYGEKYISYQASQLTNLLPNINAVVKQMGNALANGPQYGGAVSGNSALFQERMAQIEQERQASNDLTQQEIANADKRLAEWKAEIEGKMAGLNQLSQEQILTSENQARLDSAAAGMGGNFSFSVAKTQKPKTDDQKKAEADRLARAAQNKSTLVAGLSAETQAMVRELSLRQDITDTYRAADLGANASYQAQQLADIQAAEQVKTMEAQARYADDMARMEERRAQDLLRVAGDKAAIAAVNAQYDQQEILAEEMKQQSITDAQASAQDARQRLRELERQQAIDTALGLGSQLMQVTQGQSKRAFEFSKKVAIASATVDGYRAATAAWSAGMSTGGPWAPFVAAAYTASSLLKTGAQIQALRGTSFNGGGSAGGAGGGSGAPSVGAGAPAGGGGGGPSPGKFSGQTQHVTITGGFFTGAMMGEFAKEFLQYQKDGGTVIINS